MNCVLLHLMFACGSFMLKSVFEKGRKEELWECVEQCNIHDSPIEICIVSELLENITTPHHVHTLSSKVQRCSPDICISHSEGQYVSASVISKHFGVNILLIFSISTDDNVASSWESGKMLSGGHSSDVNCVWQMVLSV